MVIVWDKTAEEKLYQQINWYESNRGIDFAKTFYHNVMETVALVASMPSIGRMEKETKTKTLRSVLTHPRCRIFYRYDNSKIEIVRLYFNSKQNG